MTRPLRRVTIDDIERLSLAIRLTARARTLALRAGAQQSHKKLCGALKSLQGALRHAEGARSRAARAGAVDVGFTARVRLRSGHTISRALPTLEAARALCNRLAQRDGELAETLCKRTRFECFEVRDEAAGEVHRVSDWDDYFGLDWSVHADARASMHGTHGIVTTRRDI